MKAVDTNILVYAHRPESPHYEAALSLINGLANGSAPWIIPWPCVHEFISVVTNPRIYKPPHPLETALGALATLRTSPSLHFIAEGPTHFDILSGIALKGQVRGPRIHDARIAALCIAHGVTTLYSADRDFSAFPSLKTVNPL